MWTNSCSRNSRLSARSSPNEGITGDWPRSGNWRSLRILRGSADVRPAVLPFDLVDQQDPPAVDLVLLPLSRPVHVDCVIDHPHLPRLVRDNAIVAGCQPP